MILQLKKLFDEPGSSLDIDCSVSTAEIGEYRDSSAFASPVEIKGRVRNRAGLVTLDYSVRALLDQVCDRCLDAFQREYRYEFSHTLVTALESGDDEYEDYVVCPDNTLDIGELALSELVLELPTKILCKEDCKGLCVHCGKNLNEGSCGCETD